MLFNGFLRFEFHAPRTLEYCMVNAHYFLKQTVVTTKILKN